MAAGPATTSIPPVQRLVRLVIWCLSHLGADTTCRVGGDLGVLIWMFGLRRRVVSQQMGRCLGLTGPRRRKEARRCYATMGASFLELWTVGGPDGPERHLRVLTPHWQRHLHRAGTGVVYVSPHLGAWDIGALGIQAASRRLGVYVKAQHSADVDVLLNAQRERLGYSVLWARHGERTAALQALRMLREGGSLALLADQNPADEEAVPALLLGLPAYCHRGPAFFSQRLRLPVVPGVAVRRRAGVNYLIVGRPLAPGTEAEVVQRVMDRFSSIIAAVPGQYFWHHKRFRGTPPTGLARAQEPWRQHGMQLWNRADP